MDRLVQLTNKARHSSFYRHLLNFILWRRVPFNAPHALQVHAIDDAGITIRARNTKNNQNHIKSIHACCLATMCEYVSGLSLLLHLNPAQYRIILKNIHMTYHYQAKTTVYAKFSISKEQVQEQVIAPLANAEALFKEFSVEIYDEQNNHICTGLINWQIKAWKNVKLKL